MVLTVRFPADVAAKMGPSPSKFAAQALEDFLACPAALGLLLASK